MESPALPVQPYTGAPDIDVADAEAFRQLQARHLVAQTLSIQRTEWYVRSIRIMVLIWFVLFLIATVIGLIFGIVAATSEPEPTSSFGL